VSVANHFADILLTEFGVEERIANKQKSLWATGYPFGARAIGGLLDSTLYKAYRALHGISLTGQIAQQAVAGMEHLAARAAAHQGVLPFHAFAGLACSLFSSRFVNSTVDCYARVQ
jgi:hypothetical protein